MIKIYEYGKMDNAEIFARVSPTVNVEGVVSGIIADVIQNGDTALKAYAEKFDGVRLESLEVTREEIDAAYERADKTFLAVLEEAAENIREFHSKQMLNKEPQKKNR